MNSKSFLSLGTATLEKASSLLIIFMLTGYFCALFFLGAFFLKYYIPQASSGYLFNRPIGASGRCDISDFTLIYAAGLLNQQRFSKHPNINIYDPFLLTQEVQRIVAPLTPLEVYSIQYPPMLYILSTPLSYFNIYHAWLGMNVLSLICIVVTVLTTIGNFFKIKSNYLWSIFPCLVNVPFLHLIAIGQTSAIETAIIAFSFRLMLINRPFWAGFVAGASLLKMQFAPIAFIPGICLGRLPFLWGYLLMCTLASLLSACIVGWNNVFNFIPANYLCEISHAYVGLNDTWTMVNFRGVLESSPLIIQNINLITGATYALACILNIFLWLKVYPALKKTSKNSFELIASITVISLLVFALHSYEYDYLLMILPCLWLFKWARENDTSPIKLRMIKTITALSIIFLPTLSWINLFASSSETTLFYSATRVVCSCSLLLLLCIIAVRLEFKNNETS